MRSISALPASLLVLLCTAAAPVLSESDGDSPGLGINVVTPISCSRPTRNGDKISVNYAGRLLSTGEEFDNSYKRGKPFSFTLGAGQVIAGWDKGLLDMCPGEGRELTIPPEMGYGNRGVGTIPGGATLVFDTELMDIVGVKQEAISVESTATPTPTQSSVASASEEGAFGIATAPSTPPEDGEWHGERPPPHDDDEWHDERPHPHDDDESHHDRPEGSEGGPKDDGPENTGECQLLGPFALLVQGALGAMALLSLVWKRYRETPKRPWKIWFFDVSKQVFGSMFTHILNLIMSMFGTGGTDLVAQAAQVANEVHDAQGGRRPNPCSFYLLNLGIDTTIGIPVLVTLLKILTVAFLQTPMARPPQSIKSGNYGSPPKWTWYFKQLIIYFIGLFGMKLFVLFLLKAMPFLPWVGDWALRWTEGNESLQIAFAMFIFPLAMNALQYYIIDNFIMDKKREEGYERVHGDEDEDDEDEEHGRVEEGGSSTEAESSRKLSDEDEPLKEAEASSLPAYDGASEGSHGRNTPQSKD